MKLLLALLLIALLMSPAFSAQAYQPTPPPDAPALVARVDYPNRETLVFLVAALDIWEVHPVTNTGPGGGYLVAAMTAAQRDWLLQQGYPVTPDPARSALLTPPPPGPAQVSGGIPGYACYRTVEETYAALDALVAAYPSLAQVADIGDSWNKINTAGTSGYDLRLLRLTSPAHPGPKPHFFLMAEIHAREYTTAETATRFAEYLLQQYGSNPDVTWLLDYNEIDILPMSNPDGRKQAETGLLWRKNTHPYGTCSQYAYGVDLNRNSPFHWNQGGSSDNPCDETYHGPSQTSEPETQSIQAAIASLFADRRGPADSDPAPLDTEGLLITLHSYGNLVLWPYGWTATPAPNDAQLSVLGHKLAFFTHYTPSQVVTLYPVSGSTDDWAYGELGVAAYTIEMGTNFFESCNFFENTVWPANRAALLYGFKAARRPYQSPAGPEISATQLASPTVSIGTTSALTAQANSDTTSTLIQAARYTVDAPSWTPGVPAFPLAAADGAFNSTQENLAGAVTTTGLSAGRHTLYIEAQSGGVWGVPTALFLTVTYPYYFPKMQNRSNQVIIQP